MLCATASILYSDCIRRRFFARLFAIEKLLFWEFQQSRLKNGQSSTSNNNIMHCEVFFSFGGSALYVVPIVRHHWIAIVTTLDLGCVGILPKKLVLSITFFAYAPTPNDRMMPYNFWSCIPRPQSLWDLHYIAAVQLNRERGKIREKKTIIVSCFILYSTDIRLWLRADSAISNTLHHQRIEHALQRPEQRCRQSHAERKVLHFEFEQFVQTMEWSLVFSLRPSLWHRTHIGSFLMQNEF